MQLTKKITSLTLGVVFLFSIVAPEILMSQNVARAQTNPNVGQALEIAPPVVNLSVDPGKTLQTRIYLRNITRSNLIVTGTANDFVAAGEDGAPKVLVDEAPSNNPYSLKDWIQPPANLELVPREIKSMMVTINVPRNASPGGHYGIIRFTARAPQLNGTGVAISASLGSLLLVSVSGKVSEDLSIKEFKIERKGKTGKLFEGSNLNFITRLTNNGNVHEQPVGQIIITNMFGKRTASLNVNLPPRNVLPKSTRRFESPLDKTVIGNKRLFGRYKAVLTVTYGKDKKKITSEQTFWIIPYKLVAIILAALILAFFAIRIIVRRYNRYIIGRSQGHHRR